MELFKDTAGSATANAWHGIASDLSVTVVRVERTIEDELEELYQRIFDVAAQRRALKQALCIAFKDKCGFDSDVVDEAMGHDSADERAIAKKLLNSMLDDEARKRIGINVDVAVDGYDLHERFMNKIEEAYNKRNSYHRQEKEEAETPIPRLDIRGAIAYLRETYGGSNGEKTRIEQVVRTFKDALRLDRNSFEVKAGKVNLDFNVYSSDWELERGSYGSGAKEVLLKMVHGFEELFAHFEEPVPGGLLGFKHSIRHAGPANSYELGQAFKIRTFKSHVRLTMTEGLAEKLREFVSEYSTEN